MAAIQSHREVCVGQRGEVAGRYAAGQCLSPQSSLYSPVRGRIMAQRHESGNAGVLQLCRRILRRREKSPHPSRRRHCCGAAGVAGRGAARGHCRRGRQHGAANGERTAELEVGGPIAGADARQPRRRERRVAGRGRGAAAGTGRLRGGAGGRRDGPESPRKGSPAPRRGRERSWPTLGERQARMLERLGRRRRRGWQELEGIAAKVVALLALLEPSNKGEGGLKPPAGDVVERTARMAEAFGGEVYYVEHAGRGDRTVLVMPLEVVPGETPLIVVAARLRGRLRSALDIPAAARARERRRVRAAAAQRAAGPRREPLLEPHRRPRRQGGPE